MLLKYSLLAAM